MYFLLFTDADEHAGDSGERTAPKTHQKDTVKEKTSESIKFPSDRSSPKECEAGALDQLRVFQPLY